MNVPNLKPQAHKTARQNDLIKLAVLAVGGQGGGVLTGWINDLARQNGYVAQMTSVAGVAQRTGATVYYVEMAPKSDRTPVFAQSPAQGDLDILIAAELMEAGRAVMRGFITPDRTTLIASSHRILAVDEKQTPGDGRADSALVEQEIRAAAFQTICFDMDTIAIKNGTMISASLFGGLAKSGAMPFSIEQFESVIKSSNRGVDASLAAFRAALAFEPETQKTAPSKPKTEISGPKHLQKKWHDLLMKIDSLPPKTQIMARAGLQKTVDYQDITYGSEYLSHLATFASSDDATQETAAKYIANAMCYDDILRVADLKTRSARTTRLRREQDIAEGGIAHVTEYFHPRATEVCASLPAKLGAWIEARPKLFNWLDRRVNKGRRIKTHSIFGFSALWLIAALRPYRRSLLRHRFESEHLAQLIQTAIVAHKSDPSLCREILTCQRLIKGYSDTHERGQSKFGKVMGALPSLQSREDAADWIKRLRVAALQDETGQALDGALDTIQSFNAGA